jgi:hypothetical protein
VKQREKRPPPLGSRLKVGTLQSNYLRFSAAPLNLTKVRCSRTVAALTADLAGTDKTRDLGDSAESSEVLQFLRRNA